MLEKIDDCSRHLELKFLVKAKRALEEGSQLQLVSKRIKAIKLADKNEYGWATVNEYLSDELTSDSDDGRRIYRSEKRAQRKKRISNAKERKIGLNILLLAAVLVAIVQKQF